MPVLLLYHGQICYFCFHSVAFCVFFSFLTLPPPGCGSTAVGWGCCCIAPSNAGLAGRFYPCPLPKTVQVLVALWSLCVQTVNDFIRLFSRDHPSLIRARKLRGHVWCAAHWCIPWHPPFRTRDSFDAWNHLKQSFLKHYALLGRAWFNTIHPRLAGPANIRYALISLVQEFLFTIYLLWLHLAAFQRTSAAKLRERKKKSPCSFPYC